MFEKTRAATILCRGCLYLTTRHHLSSLHTLALHFPRPIPTAQADRAIVHFSAFPLLPPVPSVRQHITPIDLDRATLNLPTQHKAGTRLKSRVHLSR